MDKWRLIRIKLWNVALIDQDSAKSSIFFAFLALVCLSARGQWRHTSDQASVQI